MSRHSAVDIEHLDVTVGIPTRNRSDLLHKSITSVLAQSHPRFTLVISDNASTDDTAAVVASFRDPRVRYRRFERLVPKAANFNGLVEGAETDFVVLLGDDDELHPDHLAHTLRALARWPTVGVAHTGFELVDLHGNVLTRPANPFKTKQEVVFEPGAHYLERSMRRSNPAVGMSSAVFRKAAFLNSGALRESDGGTDDFCLLLRIASKWDFVYVARPLAKVMIHTTNASSEFGRFMPGGFRSARSGAEALYQNRRQFLMESQLPEDETRRLARFARRRYRQDVLTHLSMRSDTGDGPTALFTALGHEIRMDNRLALEPLTWRFVVGQLGGRQVRSVARRTLVRRRA